MYCIYSIILLALHSFVSLLCCIVHILYIALHCIKWIPLSCIVSHCTQMLGFVSKSLKINSCLNNPLPASRRNRKPEPTPTDHTLTNTGSTLYNPPLDKQPFQRHDLIKALWVHYTSHFIWTGFTASRLLTAGTV